jgi:DNA-directed RNA polymerase specialized sigma24 family protein
MWRAVCELPRRQAQVLALVAVADLTLAEAANTIGIGTETAKTHLARARSTLVARFGDEPGVDEEFEDRELPGRRHAAPVAEKGAQS